MSAPLAFNLGDLVEVETISVRAIARVRESSPTGRLHIAFEMGEYLPWVDTDVQIRHFGNDPSHSCIARIQHAGSTTAILQLLDVSAAVTTPAPVRAPYDTIPALEQDPQEPISR